MMMEGMARLGVCLCVWLVVCPAGASYVPVEMNRTIQSLLQHYNIPHRQILSGNPVVPKEPASEKMEAKMLFMGGVLEMYNELINRMLGKLPTPSPETAVSGGTKGADASEAASVRKHLSYLLKKVKELQKHHYQEQKQILHDLQKLDEIQLDNAVVQSKALWELPLLYEEASSLPNEIETQKRRRRRRRQAHRLKVNLRALK